MTIEITGNAQWQAWQEGLLPPVEKVRDGLWSIPVPIPDNPLRYVLVYALECRGGLALIDAGWDDALSWQALTSGLVATGHGVQDVTAVLVTHHHADHLGLAGRVREASGAWIAMHTLEAEVVATYGDEEKVAEDLRTHLELHGLPSAEARETAEFLRLGRFSDIAAPDVLLEDGESVRLPGMELSVVWTPGHTPGHSCFYQADRRLLFSGDHVLPRITPQIGVYRQTNVNPLADFLRSLERLDRFDVDEVLPAHEYRFRGLDRRLARMARHHAERLVELHAAVASAPGSTAWELCARLSWSRPWETFDLYSRRFALAETLAHLTLLESRGEVRQAPQPPLRWFPQPDRPSPNDRRRT